MHETVQNMSIVLQFSCHSGLKRKYFSNNVTVANYYMKFVMMMMMTMVGF